jgi:multiple sugar transport system permease protein
MERATSNEQLLPTNATMKAKRKKSPGRLRNFILLDTVRFVVLCLGAVSMVLPLLWMITVALKSNSEVFTIPPTWIPHQFHWSNFVTGTTQINFWAVFLNSVIIAVISTIGQVLSSIAIGYGIARIHFPGRRMWFYLFIGSMMLPSVVGMIPMFHLYSSLGWYNTWLPLIVPAFFGNPFFVFLTRQYFNGISQSFDEAAKMDGASHLQVLWHVLMPMSRPIIVTMIIFAFQGAWNDYQQPLIYLVNPKLWTLSLAMATYTSQYATSWNLFMAANLIYILPMVILFFVAQKYFMQGLGSLNSSGLK